MSFPVIGGPGSNILPPDPPNVHTSEATDGIVVHHVEVRRRIRRHDHVGTVGEEGQSLLRLVDGRIRCAHVLQVVHTVIEVDDTLAHADRESDGLRDGRLVLDDEDTLCTKQAGVVFDALLTDGGTVVDDEDVRLPLGEQLVHDGLVGQRRHQWLTVADPALDLVGRGLKRLLVTDEERVALLLALLPGVCRCVGRGVVPGEPL